MGSIDFRALFHQVMATTRPEQVKELLVRLGDNSERDIDEPLGDSGLMWHPVGGDEGNLSAINLATKPGRSLTERITNSEDALFELHARTDSGPLPNSPRIAAQQWFGRPISGRGRGLFAWDYAGSQDDRHIHVTLLESGREEAPTVDVLDDGIGIAARDFPATILSLRGNNKIKKFHVIGVFGQGGSSTLAFADYVIYASRHVATPEQVGFTIVRVLRLGEGYKEDCFAYLACRDAGGALTVPTATIGENSFSPYETLVVKVPEWQHGTLVRHVAFKLPGLSSTFQASPGNLYHYLHASLFDPLLPFRVVDLRHPGEEKNELVSGSRNRLMKYTLRKRDGDSETESTELRHYQAMEYIVPLGEDVPSIGVEYWVPLSWRKGKGKNRDRERILRPSSNELFVLKNHPIVGSLNGQNQGELTGALLRKLNLGMVARHIVIHVDASQAPNHVRRELFSSTREGFKDGPLLESIERALMTMLAEDDELARIERELGERVVQNENQKTEDEVKRQITRLLLDAGMAKNEEGPSMAQGMGELGQPQQKKRLAYRKREPLPTLPFPDVTRWEIVSPVAQLDVHIGDYETVLVESDADAEFDRKGLVGIRAEPPLLEVGTKAPLSGGRVRWRLRAVEGVKEGQEGRVVATITRPDGSQLNSERPFRLLMRQPEATKKSKGLIPDFDVFPVDPRKEEDRETWGRLWPELADEEDLTTLASVAYRTEHSSGKHVVYFNVLFSPFRQQEDAFIQRSAGLGSLFRVQYKIWVGYHALLQDADSADERSADSEGDLVQRTLVEETIRVATMQAKQAAQFVELKKLTLKSEEELPV